MDNLVLDAQNVQKQLHGCRVAYADGLMIFEHAVGQMGVLVA